MFRLFLRTASVCALLFLLATAAAFAPGRHGQFHGRRERSVRRADPQRLGKVRSVDSGREWQNVSNESGIYYVAALPPGPVHPAVEAPGFKRLLTNTITLEVNQTARVDLTLEVGAVAETVEVKDLAPLLQTENTQLGHVVSGNTTVNLPLNGRNFAQLTLLSPGVVTYGMGTFTSGTGGQPLVNGNRAQANNYRLDGMDSNENQDNGTGFSPNVDAIQEFKLITTNAPAEYGNSMGAIVNTSLKSGTNQYHGSAFEFLKNDHLDANNWFSNASRSRAGSSARTFSAARSAGRSAGTACSSSWTTRARAVREAHRLFAHGGPRRLAHRRSFQPAQAALQSSQPGH